MKRGKPVYLIKWKGYPESDATWEPAGNLGNIKNLIQQYESSLPDSQKGSDKSSKSEAKTKKPKSSVLDNSKKIKKEPKSSKSATGSKKNASSKKAEKESKSSKDDSETKVAKVGEFSTDEPSKISDHASLDKAKKVIRDVQEKTQISQLFFKIEWQDRSNGVKPTSTYYNFSTLKKKCPNLLLDYVSTMHCSE